MSSEPSPLVSVTVCTYNGEKYLRQQLDSILGQTYDNLEVLICDDRSTDGTTAIAEEYARRDARVVVHINQQNLGYNKNFEKAFTLASGEFIAVSDQDDIWRKEKVEKMIPLFRAEDVLLVYCQSVRFRNNVPSTKKYTMRKLFMGNDAKKLMYFNTIAGHNILFRKRLLEHALPVPANVFYDWWLAIHAAVAGSVAGTEDVFTFHRWHEDNVTLGKKNEKKQTREKAEERLRLIRNVMQIKELPPPDREFAEKVHAGLLTLEQKKFSFPLFFFLLQHANTVFFFKKGTFFSRLKMAYRLSFAT